jgi:hypothetical protein
MNRILAATALTLCACSAGSDNSHWTTDRHSSGDTSYVRITGVRESDALLALVPEWSIGSPEGEGRYSFGLIREFAVGPDNDVFIFDQQYVQLRQYDSSGAFVKVIGARGAGPGEYERVNGIAAHRDGRLVMWNAGNASVAVYSPETGYLDSWKVPGSATFNTSNAITTDTAGNTYIRTRVGDPPPSDNMAVTGRMFGITGLLRYSRDGGRLDSLRPPEVILEVPRLIASVTGSTSMSGVPFAPQFLWTFSPLGAFVSGRSDVYAIDITWLTGGVTRIEMDGERVPVHPAEKADNERVVTGNMRFTDPNWKWNGAPIPDVKPWFKQIAVGGDGRIWLSLSRPGEEIPEAELPEPRIVNDAPVPVRRWREPVVYDVFESDGSYVGRVQMPPRSTWRAARGDRVWAVTLDSLDLEHITRFRLIMAR